MKASTIPASVRSLARDTYRLCVTNAIFEIRRGDLHAYMAEGCQSVTVDAPDGTWWSVPVARSWMDF
jgi:hypothetical protein